VRFVHWLVLLQGLSRLMLIMTTLFLLKVACRHILRMVRHMLTLLRRFVVQRLSMVLALSIITRRCFMIEMVVRAVIRWVNLVCILCDLLLLALEVAVRLALAISRDAGRLVLNAETLLRHVLTMRMPLFSEWLHMWRLILAVRVAIIVLVRMLIMGET